VRIDINRHDPSGIGTFPGTYEVRMLRPNTPSASRIVEITWPLLRSRLSRVLAFDEARLAEIGTLLHQFGKTTIEDVEEPSSKQLQLMGFQLVRELPNVVAAKIRESDMFIELRNEGFISAHVVPCPHCTCSYRIFYRYPQAGPSPQEQETRAVSFAMRIGKSHPGHPEELIEAAA